MTEPANGSGHHLFGLLVAIFATLAVFLIWEYGVSYLDGTPFGELRHVIFVVAVVGMLSGLQSIISRILNH
jgi:hypothetical protein